MSGQVGSGQQALVPHWVQGGAGGRSTGTSSALWRNALIEQARSNAYRGELPGADAMHEEANPLCGDVVKIYVRLQAAGSGHPTSPPMGLRGTGQATEHPIHDSRFTVHFTGHGCIISQAAASLLCEHVQKKSVADILAMERPDMERLLGASLSPARVKCAMLPLIALKNALTSLLKRS